MDTGALTPVTVIATFNSNGDYHFVRHEHLAHAALYVSHDDTGIVVVHQHSKDREAIAAMDFFTVPTLTFGVLYCFFVISHDRRKILRFNVTRDPHALWIVQQLREAWPYTPVHRFLLLDRDSKFGDDVVSSAKAMGSAPVRTAFRSPWRNGGA